MGVARHLVFAVLLFRGVGLAFAEVPTLSESDVEKRNAAAAFVLIREFTIPTIIWECGPLLRGTPYEVEPIFQGWFERNRVELETARSWADPNLLELKAKNPAMYQRASNELIRAIADRGLKSIRDFFNRQLPSQSACELAVKNYEDPQLDFKNMPRFFQDEKIGEFIRTLEIIRSEPGYKPAKVGYDAAAAFRRYSSNMATLDAAEAAKERGDGQATLMAYQSLAKRGDGAGAQVIGLMYLNGRLVQKNPIEAYRWFYAAWSLADYNGLNAMGVMLRDGIGISRDLPVAQAAFLLTTVVTRDNVARDRAQSNSDRLMPQIDADDVRRIACFSLGSLDGELKKPIQAFPPLVPGDSLNSAERKLGVLIPRLTTNFNTDSCK
jgi:hypothetical protein